MNQPFPGLVLGSNPSDTSQRVTLSDDPQLATVPPAIKGITPGFVMGSLSCGLLMDPAQAGLHEMIYENAAMQLRLYVALASRSPHTIEQMVLVFLYDENGVRTYCAALDDAKLGGEGFNHPNVHEFLKQHHPIAVMFLSTVVNAVDPQQGFRCASEMITSGIHAQSFVTVNPADPNRVIVENQLRPRITSAEDPYWMIPYIPVANLDDLLDDFEESSAVVEPAAPEFAQPPPAAGVSGIEMARAAFGDAPVGVDGPQRSSSAVAVPGVPAPESGVPGVGQGSSFGHAQPQASTQRAESPVSNPQRATSVAVAPVPEMKAPKPSVDRGTVVATATAVGLSPDDVPAPAEKKRPMVKSQLPFVSQGSGTQEAPVVPLQSEDPRQYASNLPRGMRPGISTHEATVTPMGGGVSTHQPPIVPAGEGHRTTPAQLAPGTGDVLMAPVSAVDGQWQTGGQQPLDHSGQVQVAAQPTMSPQQIQQAQQAQQPPASGSAAPAGVSPHQVQPGQTPAGGLHPEQKPPL